MRIALFPGSFDPIHNGHVDIVRRILPLFDKIIIGIGNNPSKQYYFTVEERKARIEAVFRNEPCISVAVYSGLTVAFCQQVKASYIIRGLRHAGDFEFEQAIAQMNQAMDPSIQTVFIPCRPALSAISSSIIRDILRNGGHVDAFVP
jgi:pantetheine-phosphate adenylyltransferase